MFDRAPTLLSRFQVTINNHKTHAYIEVINSVRDINTADARRIMVESFIAEYSTYLQPADIDASLTSWRGGEQSVQHYYEKYFAQEYQKYADGKIPFWITAYVGHRLVGWATFEHEQNNSVYMDLLMVDPTYQDLGIGKQLVFSLQNSNLVPNLQAVHLLLREKNQGGRQFYSAIGFKEDNSYQRKDNYVDLSLLVPLTCQLAPKNQERLSPK